MLKNEINKNSDISTNYLQINMDFFNNEKYKDLDLTSIFLYSFYVNRVQCSIYNSSDGSWTDSENRIYILFSNEEARKLLRVSARKITNCRQQLIEKGLIEIKKIGLKQNRIYVSQPDHEEKTDVIAPYKNQQFNKQPHFKPLVANNATSNTQNSNTRTIKNSSSDTKDTKETITEIECAKNAFSTVDNDSLFSGLKARYKHIINSSVFTRLKQITKSDYMLTKWYLDTIFKAKRSAENLFIAANLPYDYFDTLTFEGNEYLKNRLESAIIVTLEQIHRYKKVHNKAGFFFIFMRGFFIEQVKEYISDHFEMNHKLITILNSVQNKNPEHKVGVLNS